MKKGFVSLLISIFLFSCNTNKDKTGENSAAGNSDTSAVFNWADDACEYTGTYDPKLYTKEQLKNIYDLWFTFSGLPLNTDGIVFEPGQVSRLSIDSLTKEYLEKKKLYSSMSIISTPLWNDLKKKRMDELETDFEFKKITITAYTDPSILLNNRFTQYCPEYARVLASPDTTALVNEWKQLAERLKQKNGNPEFYMKRFYEKYYSNNRLAYARCDLIVFGWWNCVNANIPHTGSDPEYQNQFSKLFRAVTPKCEEVD